MKKEIDKTYDNAIVGSLKLKGKIICKHKNKVVHIPTDVKEDEFVTLPTNISNDDKKSDNQTSSSTYNTIEKRIELVKNNPNLTSSEKSFMIARIKRTHKRVNEALKEGHRDKIENFNNKLSKLSEHFDIPRVGPG